MRSNKPTSQDADSRILTVCIRFEFQIGHSIVKFSFSNKAKKDLPNLLHGFDIYLVDVRQNNEKDCANFCGLLRKAELQKKL